VQPYFLQRIDAISRPMPDEAPLMTAKAPSNRYLLIADLIFADILCGELGVR
jgi:hypothetical protein